MEVLIIMKKSFIKKMSMLTAVAAVVLSLSACSEKPTDSGSTTTAAPAATTTAAPETTKAPETTTTAAPAPAVLDVSINDLVNIDGTLIYDGMEDLNKLPTPGDCDYPGDQGNIGPGAGRLAIAGGPTFFIGDDNRGIGVSGRANEWDSIDVTVGGLEIGKYKLVAVFNANEEVTFNIKDADSPWTSHVSIAGTTDTTLEFDFEITEAGKSNDQNRFRLNLTDDPDYKNYYVKAIGIYSMD